MTAIWASDQGNWKLLEPTEFLLEATLHGLIKDAPELLPLSGTSELLILGSEVACGSGSADLVGIEPNGRVVILEVKLAKNAEAKRAVVAQLLSYAAAVKGDTVAAFEHRLAKHLAAAGKASVAQVVEDASQDGSFDAVAFRANLAANLATGAFRLVFVLDSAPADLIRLVGYLEETTHEDLLIDLITITAFDVGGRRVLVPRRVDPGAEPSALKASTAAAKVATVTGVEDFEQSIPDAPPNAQADLERLTGWAKDLRQKGLARLSTANGSGRKVLRVRVEGHEAGLVAIWNDGGAYVSAWRSVFETFAPVALAAMEHAVGPLGQGKTLPSTTDDTLALLTGAYAEAAANVAASKLHA